MSKYHLVASVVFVNLSGKLIFQWRENKPGIRNPGLITAWGGAVEDGETVLQAAEREVAEETNLRPQEDDFIKLGVFPRNQEIHGKQIVNHVFLLKNVDEQKLQVFEGEGYITIDIDKNAENSLFTELTREIIETYKKS